MAEALFSVVLERIASVTRQQKETGVILFKGVEKQVKRLASSLRAIEAVLADAEDRQVGEIKLRGWLDKLKEISYDIEDVLNEWITAIRDLQTKKDNEAAAKSSKKVSPLASSHFFSLRQVYLRYNLSRKIRVLNERLDIIAMERRNLSLTIRNTEETEKPRGRMSTCYVDLSRVHGRDHEKKTLVNLILSESSQESTLSTFAIVGMGGIGKTTLAQIVFNDDRVSTHFDEKIWVCISNHFNMVKVAKAILESLNGVRQNSDNLETLLGVIQQSIIKKRFFLVLDDVWIEDSVKYRKLKHSLQSCSPGSTVLVTTRKESTAKVMGATEMISLQKLPNQECWSIFKQVANFPRKMEGEHIAKEIVGKCLGVPLLVNTVGNLLLGRPIEEWEKVRCSELGELEEVREAVLPSLLLSYDDLPYLLKRCFLYCVIFSKDYMITKDKSVKLWMAQGYLEEIRKDAELVGESYLEDLAKCSFFQDIERSDYDGSIIRCKMPNIIHDMAKLRAKNEFSAIEIDNVANSQVVFNAKEARHLMIIGNKIPDFIYGNKKVRSLVVESTVSNPSDVVDLFKLFDQLTCLRTLDLSRCSIEEIQGVQKLRQLRYLNLSQNSKMEELPESLCELFYLQILDVTNCYHLKKLPHGIGRLTNLRHLRNHGTSLSYMPRGIHRLTSLRQLSKFVVSNVDNDPKACALEHLANFEHLRGFLMITGLGNVKGPAEVNQGKLRDKKELIGLGLRFDGWMYDEDKGTFKEIQPPRNLKELMIEYYVGKLMPLYWIMQLTELRVLKLSSCFECEKLPSLGRLSSLESLYIWKMASVKHVGDEFLREKTDEASSSSSAFTAFPKLKYLTIWNMEEWKRWEYGNDFHFAVMPALHSLKLQSCPNLECLPSHFFVTPKLQKLVINSCPLLQKCYEGAWHTICRTPIINNCQKCYEKGVEEATVSPIPEFLVKNDAGSSNSQGLVHYEIEEE